MNKYMMKYVAVLLQMSWLLLLLQYCHSLRCCVAHTEPKMQVIFDLCLLHVSVMCEMSLQQYM